MRCGLGEGRDRAPGSGEVDVGGGREAVQGGKLVGD